MFRICGNLVSPGKRPFLLLSDCWGGAGLYWQEGFPWGSQSSDTDTVLWVTQTLLALGVAQLISACRFGIKFFLYFISNFIFCSQEEVGFEINFSDNHLSPRFLSNGCCNHIFVTAALPSTRTKTRCDQEVQLRGETCHFTVAVQKTGIREEAHLLKSCVVMEPGR